jgi:hypothetical protein
LRVVARRRLGVAGLGRVARIAFEAVALALRRLVPAGRLATVKEPPGHLAEAAAELGQKLQRILKPLLRLLRIGVASGGLLVTGRRLAVLRLLRIPCCILRVVALGLSRRSRGEEAADA